MRGAWWPHSPSGGQEMEQAWDGRTEKREDYKEAGFLISLGGQIHRVGRCGAGGRSCKFTRDPGYAPHPVSPQKENSE